MTSYHTYVLLLCGVDGTVGRGGFVLYSVNIQGEYMDILYHTTSIVHALEILYSHSNSAFSAT